MADFGRVYPPSIIVDESQSVIEQTFTFTMPEYSPVVLNSDYYFPSAFACVVHYLVYSDPEANIVDIVHEVTVPATVIDMRVRTSH